MSDIEDQVKKIVVEHLGIDESKVIVFKYVQHGAYWIGFGFGIQIWTHRC